MLILEERLLQQEKSSFDGNYLWKITSVAEKIKSSQTSKRKCFYSPPFYTSHGGYKMAGLIYLNGDGDSFNQHISLYLVILRGNFDSLNDWPFTRKVTFIMMDRSEHKPKHFQDSFKPNPAQSDSFRKPISEMNRPAGLPKFISLGQFNDINENDFFSDDSLFIRMIIH